MKFNEVLTSSEQNIIELFAEFENGCDARLQLSRYLLGLGFNFMGENHPPKVRADSLLNYTKLLSIEYRCTLRAIR